MKHVRRFEQGRMDGAPERTPQGFLKVRAYISRTGIQLYQQPDGTVRREYRPPEEVFSIDALRSFELAPLTLLHPPEPVTADNVEKYRVGTIGEDLRPTGGKYVGTTIVVQNRDAIVAVERNVRELSCGYGCDLDETPGEVDGERYDAVQRKIRGNHVALVPMGRAGPEVSLKLDETDAVQVEVLPPPNEGRRQTEMEKIKIDGVEYEVSTQAAQAFRKVEKDRADALTKALNDAIAAKAEGEKQKARADTADLELAKEKKARTDAEDPKRIQESVKARVLLERSAAEVLGTEEKLDGLTDMEIKKKVIAKVQPDLKLDGQSDAYVLAAYDIAVKAAPKKKDRITRVRVVDKPDHEDENDDETREDDDEDPQARFMKRARGMHKKSLTASAK